MRWFGCELLSALIAWALAVSLAAGEAEMGRLSAIRDALGGGDYRQAARELNELAKSEPQLSEAERLQYWDMCADVALESGLLDVAQNSALKHLAFVRQAVAAGSTDQVPFEQAALVRLARIERAFSPAASKKDLRDDASLKHWNAARDYLVKSLAIRGGLRQTDAVWEAETRLQLGQTLETLGAEPEARAQFAAAGQAALAVASPVGEKPTPVPLVLRAMMVAQYSHATGDKEGERQQAQAALASIEKRLQAADLTVGDRVALLVAAAACQRQLQDVPGETRLLREALSAGDKEPSVDPLLLADAKFRLAELADAVAETGKPRQAIDLYRDAAAAYSAILTKGGVAAPGEKQRPLAPGQQAQCLLQLQSIYMRLEEWDDAISAAEDLLRLRSRALLATRDPNYFRAKSAVGSLYAKSARSELARTAGEGRDYASARESAVSAQKHLKDAVSMWRSYRPLSQKDLAVTMNYYAEALRYNGEFRQAEEMLEEARPHFEAAYEPTALPLGEFHSNRGAALAALGMFTPARESYQAAIQVARSEGAVDDVRARGQLSAFVHLNMAQLYKSQGQFALARKECTEAGAEAEKWLGRADRAPFLLADAALGIVEAERAYRAIEPNPRGEAARLESEKNQKSVETSLAAAIVAAEQVVNEAAGSADPLNVASARHLQALALYRRNSLLPGYQPTDLAQAKQLWEQIADAPNSRGDLRTDILRVRALNSLAAINLREAMQMRAQSTGQLLEEEAAAALIAQIKARIADASGRSIEAEQIAERMVAYPAVRFQALLTRAQILVAESQISRAEQMATQSADATSAAPPSKQAPDGSAQEAIALLRRALELVELPRAMTTGAEEQRSAYFAQFSPGFDLLVNLLVETGRWREALEVSEQRRSRTFLDQLKIAGVDLHQTVPESKQGLVAEAEAIRDKYYTTLALLVDDGTASAKASKLAAELKTLQGQLIEAESQIRSASTVYQQLLAEPIAGNAQAELAMADGDWVASQLGAGDDVALVYYIGAEKSYVFECSRKEIRATPLRVSLGLAKDLGLAAKNAADAGAKDRPLGEEDVAKLVSWITRNQSHLPDDSDQANTDGRENDADVTNRQVTERGQDLETILAPKIQPQHMLQVTDMLVPKDVQSRIKNSSCQHVIVVPDGPLHQLAFESLPVALSPSTYLLDEFPPICYVPSLQIYRQLQGDAGERGDPTTVLTVADPQYHNANAEVRQALPEGLSSLEQEFRHYYRRALDNLPDTKVESDSVRQAFEKIGLQPDGIISLTSDAATEANLKDILARMAAAKRRVGFLHLAAHGLVDQRYNNLFGALALTPPNRPSAADDGFLTLYEVMTLPLAGCDLAVLSACQTNCGTDNALEAGSTMARAFFCAGTRRVVCSQWSVNDAATASLVAGFTDDVTADLAAGRDVDYAKALTEAKRKLRVTKKEPYYWAPFVLIGTPMSGGAGAERPRLAGTQE